MTPTSADEIHAQVIVLMDRFERFEKRTDENFHQVKEKQDRTNGRVTKLERLYGTFTAVVVIALALAPYVLPRLL